MNPLRRSLIPILLMALVLSACGGAPATESAQLDFILTEGVKTMVASYFETQTALAPVATATLPPTITPSPALTPVGFPNPLNPTLTATFIYYPTSVPFTSTVTGTPPTATLTSGGFGCNNLALLYEIYPNGSNEVKPGEAFFMSWKVHNSGTCEWKSYYRLSFVSGTNMDPRINNLGKIIPVDKNPEISIQLDAPNRTGSFTAHFRMSDGNGNLFGSTLPVTIKVVGDPTNTVPPTQTPSVTPTVTPSVTPTVTPSVTLTP